MPSHCNSYGFSGGFAAIFAFVAWYLVDNKACRPIVTYLFSDQINSDHFRLFHYIAIIVGIVLFVLSFFDFAGTLYEIRLLFVLASMGLFAAGGMMAYAAYIAFHISCKSFIESGLDAIAGAKNVIQANDEVGITVLVLDILAACTLISAAISFSRF